jgi:hypothetical protein
MCRIFVSPNNKAMKPLALLSLLLLPFLSAAQLQQSRFVIETTLDGKSPAIYEENYGTVRLSPNTGDISFYTNLADVKTNNAKTDSLLQKQETIRFSFEGNLREGLASIINEVNNDKFHKVEGTLYINTVAYPMEAYVKIDNFGDRSNFSKAMMDLKLTVDPAIISLPCLSDYFKNTLVMQVNDGAINIQN